MSGPNHETAHPDREAGSVLPLLAVFLFVLLVVGALAVDLSALERRGESLQKSADAAALAGVAVWHESGDVAQTESRVADLIRQNGLSGDNIEVTVSAGPNEVEVVVVDTEPDLYLGRMVASDGRIERAARARLDACDQVCSRTVDLPPPFPPTSVIGAGDGFYPVAVGSRFYAVNHDGDQIACIDRVTQNACWTGRLAMPYAGPVTGAVAHLVTTDTRLFFSGQEADRLSLFCWQTLTESPCPQTPIATLARADALGQNWRQRGGGLVEVEQQLFMFTDDHRVHCVDSRTMATCSGYDGGLSTGLGRAGMEPLNPTDGVSGSNIDRVYDDRSGRIYHTLQILRTAQSEQRYEPGVHLDCWDTINAQPCSGFTPSIIHPVAQRQAGRLFLHRSADGTPDGLCSTGLGDIQCVGFDGREAPGLEFGLVGLETRLPLASSYSAGMGVHTYHPATNRLIVTTSRQLSTNHCWDFTTASYCGSFRGLADGRETQDYGFLPDGDCLYGLGHTSILWAVSTDLTQGCAGSTVEVWLTTCPCGGQDRWPFVTFTFDVTAAQPIAVLNVQVLDEARQVIYPPAESGDEWVRMVGRPSDIIDLSSISTAHDGVWLRVYLEADTVIPWEGPEPPAIRLQFREIPYLVE